MIANDLKIFYGMVAFLVVGRLYELYLTKKNERVWIEEYGAQEVGVKARYFMVTFHSLWFVSLILEAVLYGHLASLPIQLVTITMLISAQVLRFHSMSVLRELWSTRVYACPNPPVLREGLLKYVRHPNYIAVILEFIALPLHYELWWTLTIFGIMNLIFLKTRMNLEEKVLGKKLAPWAMIPGIY